MSQNKSDNLKQIRHKQRISSILSVFCKVLLVFLILLSLYLYNFIARDHVPPLIDQTENTVLSSAVVHYIDVGQADAACIVLNSGETVLIDAGSNASEDKLLSYLSKYGIHRIDYAVFSHPHEDHIGGADAIFDSCMVENVILPDAVSTGSTYDILLEKIAAEDCTVNKARVGDTYTLGDASFSILGPAGEIDSSNFNNASILLRFVCGNTSFLFTGDAEYTAESAALQILDTSAFSSTVIKIGHHGSSTSSSDAFLSAVSPDVAVISCGPQNEYGHPHKEVLDRISSYTDNIFRTDQSGSIRIHTDGETLVVRCDRGTPDSNP